VKLYCERAIFNSKSKGYDVIFDFHSEKDLKTIIKMKKVIADENNHIKKSLLYIENLKVKPYKGPKSGFWYEVPLKELELLTKKNEEIESSLIMLKLDGKNKKQFNFQEFKTIGWYRDVKKFTSLKDSKLWLALDQMNGFDLTYTLIV